MVVFEFWSFDIVWGLVLGAWSDHGSELLAPTQRQSLWYGAPTSPLASVGATVYSFVTILTPLPGTYINLAISLPSIYSRTFGNSCAIFLTSASLAFFDI